MFRPFRASLLCALSLLALPSLAQNSYHRAASNGRFRDAAGNGVAINVNAFQSVTQGQVEVWGTLSVISNSVYVNTTPASEYYSVLSGGVKHVCVVSKPFLYGGTLCALHVTLTQTGRNGQGSYRILPASSSSVSTTLKETPFVIGSVQITE